MTIYFIEMEGTNSIKIGFTANNDVTARMRQLQTGQPKKLRLLGSLPGDQDAERTLHAVFAGYRSNGEWFDGPPVFRRFLVYAITNGWPWSYFRAYGVFDELLGELASKVERMEEARADGRASRELGWTPEAFQKQVNRLHRRYKEQRAIVETLQEENAALLARLDPSKPLKQDEYPLDLLEMHHPVLEMPMLPRSGPSPMVAI